MWTVSIDTKDQKKMQYANTNQINTKIHYYGNNTTTTTNNNNNNNKKDKQIKWTIDHKQSHVAPIINHIIKTLSLSKYMFVLLMAEQENNNNNNNM